MTMTDDETTPERPAEQPVPPQEDTPFAIPPLEDIERGAPPDIERREDG
jgi:hypothetical protein